MEKVKVRPTMFPGVEMSYISLLTDQATYSHVPDEWVLEINYSILGQLAAYGKRRDHLSWSR